jgi:hypothetical protein
MHSYRNWMRALRGHLDKDPSAKIVLRHDADFDIDNCRRMMEIERDLGLVSVAYVDIHDPNYTMEDIRDLHRDFSGDGFLFGLHVNTAYGRDPDDALAEFQADLWRMEAAGIRPHSIVAHAFSERIVSRPAFSNFEVVAWNDEKVGQPPSFLRAFFNGGQVWKLGDGGGTLSTSPLVFLDLMRHGESAYLSFHPIHFRKDGEDLIFTKPIGYPHPHSNFITSMQQALQGTITPYLAFPKELQPHLDEVSLWLEDYLTSRYRDVVRVLDAGCGIGLLGAHLMRFNNLRYEGFDIEPRWIEAGRAFMASLGYAPNLFVGNLFADPLPEADVLVFLAAEDCPCDYPRLYEVALGYPNFIVSIIGEEMYRRNLDEGKWRVYIGEECFEELFGEGFDIVEKSAHKRITYWLRRKGGA